MSELKEFMDHYTGDPNFNCEGSEGCEGRMETYLPYTQQVWAHHEKKPKTVWTVVEDEDYDDYNEDGEPNSGLVVIPGYHLVNRILHFISNEEWASEDECYAW